MSVNQLLRSTRDSVLRVLTATGVSRRVARSEWRRRRLLILCYHGVAVRDEHDWSPLYVSADHLRSRLERLDTLGATVLPLDEALHRLHAGSLPELSVVITFDDGAADFRTVAYPILESRNVPVTLYQSTWHVDKPFPVFDNASSYLLWQARGTEVLLPWRTDPALVPFSIVHPEFQRLHQAAKAWHASAPKTDQWTMRALELLAESCNSCLRSMLEARLLQFMTSDELRSLNRSLVNVQLHTHRHRSPEDHALFAAEISENREALERILGTGAGLNHFCYPSGIHSAFLRSCLRDAGICSATTCEPSLIDASTDVLRLPRLVDAMSVSEGLFDAWVTGMAHFTRLPLRGSPE